METNWIRHARRRQQHQPGHSLSSLRTPAGTSNEGEIEALLSQQKQKLHEKLRLQKESRHQLKQQHLALPKWGMRPQSAPGTSRITKKKMPGASSRAPVIADTTRRDERKSIEHPKESHEPPPQYWEFSQERKYEYRPRPCPRPQDVDKTKDKTKETYCRQLEAQLERKKQELQHWKDQYEDMVKKNHALLEFQNRCTQLEDERSKIQKQMGTVLSQQQQEWLQMEALQQEVLTWKRNYSELVTDQFTHQPLPLDREKDSMNWKHLYEEQLTKVQALEIRFENCLRQLEQQQPDEDPLVLEPIDAALPLSQSRSRNAGSIIRLEYCQYVDLLPWIKYDAEFIREASKQQQGLNKEDMILDKFQEWKHMKHQGVGFRRPAESLSLKTLLAEAVAIFQMKIAHDAQHDELGLPRQSLVQLLRQQYLIEYGTQCESDIYMFNLIKCLRVEYSNHPRIRLLCKLLGISPTPQSSSVTRLCFEDNESEVYFPLLGDFILHLAQEFIPAQNLTSALLSSREDTLILPLAQVLSIIDRIFILENSHSTHAPCKGYHQTLVVTNEIHKRLRYDLNAHRETPPQGKCFSVPRRGPLKVEKIQFDVALEIAAKHWSAQMQQNGRSIGPTQGQGFSLDAKEFIATVRPTIPSQQALEIFQFVTHRYLSFHVSSQYKIKTNREEGKMPPSMFQTIVLAANVDVRDLLDSDTA